MLHVGILKDDTAFPAGKLRENDTRLEPEVRIGPGPRRSRHAVLPYFPGSAVAEHGRPADYRYAPLPGRALLPILEQTNSVGFDRIFATHSFHEINQYYPMRSVRTRRYSYFLNLEPSLAVPVASDVQLSPSWKAIIGTPGAKLGKRTLDAFTHRPSEELYDIAVDPDEVVNLAAEPSHATVMADLRKQVRDWRAATHDPWLPGITDPFGHAH